MYILKNSAQNLRRNKSRNILIGIIMFAVIAATAISIIINTTTSGIIDDYKSRFGSEVFLQPNLEKLMSNSSNGKEMITFPQITTNQYVSFAESDYLKESIFTGYLMTYSEKLKGLDQGEESDRGGFSMSMIGPDGGTSITPTKTPNLNIIGNSNYESLEEFKKGTRNISEGRFYKDINECIISEDFAKLNNLKVGDSIEISSSFGNEKDVKLNLTITGLYSDLTGSSENSIFKSAMTNRKNEILTSHDTLWKYSNLFKSGESPVSIDVKYYLKDPELLDKFAKELSEKGLDDIFEVKTDEYSYNRIVEPVKGLAKISKTFLIVVLLFGSVLLILLSILAVRERKYEIGVLRAMGMEKAKVAIGFICETMIIIVICLGLGLGVGSVAAQPVSDMMIENQLKANEKTSSSNGGFGEVTQSIIGGSVNSSESVLEDIDVSLSSTAIIEIIGIALFLGLISSGIGIFYIMKYEPIKILSERN